MFLFVVAKNIKNLPELATLPELLNQKDLTVLLLCIVSLELDAYLSTFFYGNDRYISKEFIVTPWNSIF